jgi:hypothetical protein
MNNLELDGFAVDSKPRAGRGLKDYTQADFEDWLRVGLENHVLRRMGSEAFPGASAELAFYDFPAEGLEAAYGQLFPIQQGYFRSAVANLINSWEINDDNFVLLEHLLHLAVLLPAKEVLRGLGAWIRAFYRQLPEALAGKLFSQIFLTATRLAAPNQESVDCIRELVALPQFRSDWAGMALETLWFCDSGNISGHLQRLRPYLRDLMADAPQRQRVWAKRILEKVGLYNLVKVLPTLRYYDSGGDGDTWLLEGLLTGEQPLLECWVAETGDQLYFRMAGNKDTEEILTMKSELSYLFLYLRERKMLNRPDDQSLFEMFVRQHGKSSSGFIRFSGAQPATLGAKESGESSDTSGKWCIEGVNWLLESGNTGMRIQESCNA